MDRPDLYVVARILERLYHEPNPMLKTRLQVAVGTNYDVFVKYLEWMRTKGLIAIVDNDGHQMVRLTEDGSESYSKLVVWINETVHGKVRTSN